MLSFTAFGVPETQGSTRAFVQGGRAIQTSANPKLRPWRDTVLWAARDAMGTASGFERVIGPARCTITFWMPRPKSAPKTRDIMPAVGKDLDKLVRAVLDSLTNAGVWRDDSQVVSLHAEKRYSVGPELAKIYEPGWHMPTPGAHIVVFAI